MKMEDQDYQALKELIQKHVTKEMLAQHREGLKTRKDCKDREMRLRWDALWYTEAKERKEGKETVQEWFKNSYTYMNDNHIDTALKAIMKEIEEG